MACVSLVLKRKLLLAKREAISQPLRIGQFRPLFFTLMQTSAPQKSWFRVSTLCANLREPFIDFYPAASVADALAMARADADAFGLPASAVQTARLATGLEAAVCASLA